MHYLPIAIQSNTFFLLLVLVLSIITMWKSAVWLVDSACRIALKLSVSPLVIGLTIIAIGTSAPEFAVSLQAALQGNPEIAIGNVFGSNIFNLGFILGIGAIFGNLTTDKQTVYHTGGFLIFGVAIFYLFCFGLPTSISEGYLSTTLSVFMLVMLICYIFFLYFQKKPSKKITKEDSTQQFRWNDILLLLAGLGLIILASHFLVTSGSLLGKKAGLSDWIIGITIVAIGTSCPELVTTLVAISKKKQSVAVGNLLGSDLFNLLGVIGVAGIASKGIPMLAITNFSLLILFFNLLLVVFLLRTGWKLRTWEGFLLVFISILRYILDFSYL